MLLKMIVPPVIYPVSLEEAKLHARVEHADEDVLFLAQISAATVDCEKETRRQMVEATLEMVIDSFPGGAITLPRPPVSEVINIAYIDAYGQSQIIPDANYELEGSENVAFIIPLKPWPSGSRVRVRYKAGWPVTEQSDAEGNIVKKATTPDALRWWILVRSTGLYEQRTNLASATRKIAIEMSRDFMPGLLDKYRLYGPDVEI